MPEGPNNIHIMFKIIPKYTPAEPGLIFDLFEYYLYIVWHLRHISLLFCIPWLAPSCPWPGLWGQRRALHFAS